MHKMVVFAKAAPGRKQDLARWYDERHIGDVLTTPGVLTAERHEVVPLKRSQATPAWDFMLIYAFEGDDPLQVVRAMGETTAASVQPTSDALESVATLAVVGVSCGKRSAG